MERARHPNSHSKEGKENLSNDHRSGYENGANNNKASRHQQAPRTRCGAMLAAVKRNAFIITMMLNTTIESLTMAVRGQYRYRFFHHMHEDELHSYNASNQCGGELPEVKAIENKISQETSMWSMYDLLVVLPPMMVASVVLGMKSDQIGRRFLFLFPFATSLVECGLWMAVIWFKLHYGWTLIGGVAWGISGGSISMHFASLALISDSYNKHEDDRNKEHVKDGAQKTAESEDTDLDFSRERSRTYKFVLLDIINMVGASAMGFASGYIIIGVGFFYSMTIVLVVKCAIFFFAFAFIEESVQQKKSISFILPLKIIYRALKDPRKRLTLIFINVANVLYVFAIVSELNILRTYQMSPPYCLNAEELGWISGENRVISLFTMPVLWFWHRLRLSESTIAAIGMAFEAAGQFLMATLRMKWVFFAAPFISIPGKLSGVMAKTITSRMIGREAFASTFALMMLSMEIFAFIGTVTSNYVYQYTVASLPSAFLYLGGASFTAACIFYIAETISQCDVRLHRLLRCPFPAKARKILKKDWWWECEGYNARKHKC
ncbi:solute carrier family 46 member 3-like isoform X1 [Pomacea canaliculata]|uniref:solute carrier family 46 member 3-like isoform X1 n=1 Tax=Pomacea canaliculata TaxID=400727 RepID=UPI000D73F7B9|nr:solute carrier family 46 member 3-like isoform X1 [Pomacea canaliculata]